jgi:hypothetical protein
MINILVFHHFRESILKLKIEPQLIITQHGGGNLHISLVSILALI